MKKSVSRLVQGFFALSALCLLAALALPWQNPSPPPAPPGSPGVRPVDLGSQRPAAERVSPDSVLSLFGKARNPAPARAVLSPEPGTPVDAPWLLYLGFYSSTAGGPSYLLKDNRSGRLITAEQRSDSAQGWSVVSVDTKQLIVRNDSGSFIVRKR